MALITRSSVRFLSGGDACAAWHYLGAAGPVCVVMAHGLGGTREGGLAPFAEKFAEAGYQVLVFDYRHFGDSEGQPRQVGTIEGQLADWRAAVEYALGLSGVQRVVLWGTSFSGGHVLTSAARMPFVAGVIAQNPMLDGRAAFLQAALRVGPLMVLRTTLLALYDTLRGLLGLSPYTIPIAAAPGSVGFLTAPDSLNGYLAVSPPHACNQMAARLALKTANYRPIRQAARVKCPVLIQICETDTVAPTGAAERTASRLARAEVKRYPIGHFDIYFGSHFERAVTDQLEFLRRL